MCYKFLNSPLFNLKHRRLFAVSSVYNILKPDKDKKYQLHEEITLQQRLQ